MKLNKMKPAIDPDFYYGGVGGLGNAGATISSSGLNMSRDENRSSVERIDDYGKISSYNNSTIP